MDVSFGVCVFSSGMTHAEAYAEGCTYRQQLLVERLELEEVIGSNQRVFKIRLLLNHFFRH